MKKESVKVLLAQKELLDLLSHKEAKDHFEFLKMVNYLATYSVDSGMVKLWASQRVHDLMDVIQNIALENTLSKNKI